MFRDRLWNFEERMKVKNLIGTIMIETYIIQVFSLYHLHLEVFFRKICKKREQEVNKFNKERVKMVETGGVKVEDLITKKNPFKKENVLKMTVLYAEI